MNTPTTENGNNLPKRQKTLFKGCLAWFAGVGIALFLFWLFFFFVLGPEIIRKSINADGYPFFRDMESSLRGHYGEAVMVREEWSRLGRDDFFHVDISTFGENAPPPTEIAREIYQLKKQSEFMSKEILIVTINGDREDHGIRFILPGKNGYRSASKPTFFSAVSRRQ